MMSPHNGFYWFVVLVSVVCIGGSGRESQLRIGKSINIFVRYGYLGISMRVIPYNENYETEKWLFKEPTKNIYKNMSTLAESDEQINTPGVFHGDFHLEFCDNRRQLFQVCGLGGIVNELEYKFFGALCQAYFRDFTIENLDKPWEAFTGGWFMDNAAKKLGINTSYIQGDYSYVLVRVVRFRETGKLKTDLPLNLTLEDDVLSRMKDLETGNVTATIKFMEAFGTHYINSYTTGNSLFQVFVYNRQNYHKIKNHIKAKGINGVSKADLYNFFAPWFASHLGQIRSASANATVERWAKRKLQYEYYVVKYVSLLKLHGNGTLLRSLDSLLGNDAILKMDLRSLRPIFRDEPAKQNWFHEVLDNQMKLWELNMPQH